MDFAAAEFLGELRADLASRGVDLRIAGANGQVVDVLEAVGMNDELSGVSAEETAPSTIDRWRRNRDEACGREAE